MTSSPRCGLCGNVILADDEMWAVKIEIHSLRAGTYKADMANLGRTSCYTHEHCAVDYFGNVTFIGVEKHQVGRVSLKPAKHPSSTHSSG